MLLFIAIVITLQLAKADGFLENCPIDKTHRIGDLTVVNVLKRFYNDLVLVGAAAETCQRRDYTQVIADVNGSGGPDPFLNNIATLLSENKLEDAEHSLSRDPDQWYASDARRRTYLDYFQAEANRLLDNDIDALEFGLKALAGRHASTGISVDALERLNSILTLKAVSRFNRDVDRVHGLIQSPNYEKLPLLHKNFKTKLAAWSETRFRIANKFIGVIDTKPGAMKRANPELDDFSGQSLSKVSVEGILCEFARKLSILGINERVGRSFVDDDYYSELDSASDLWSIRFADDLKKAVEYFKTDMEDAHDALYKLWLVSPLQEDRESFIRYFTIEWDRLSKDSCYLLSKMLRGIGTIKRLREENRGIGLGPLIYLEAKVLLKSMTCVHRRVTSFYQLSGNENEQQLEAKRLEFGRGDRKLPLYALSGPDPIF